MSPLWVDVVLALLVALAIAALAFVAGHLMPGSGVIVAALGSTLWVAYSASRARKICCKG